MLRLRLATLAALLFVSLRAPAAPASHGLVDLQQLSPPPLLEIRYATPYNFTGAPLYPFAAAFLHADAAAALQRAQRSLAPQGLGLKVFDGYRPLSVQQRMWDLVRDERYVANPAANAGRHTRGTAVDLTLVDALGNELPMPTPYDDFSPAAHVESNAASDEARANAAALRAAMLAAGFDAYPYEWWHFDYRGWEQYPPLDLGFEELRAR